MTLTTSITSFSYRKGLPQDSSGNGGGYIFDCRALVNPGREEAYRCKTGRDSEVIQLLSSDLTAQQFLSSTQSLIKLSIENYLTRDFSSLAISFGCTGGQHRSVYCAEITAQWISISFKNDVIVSLNHRDMPSFATP